MSKSGTRPDNTQRLLSICGIIAPILYTIVVITLGLLRPGYNHVTQFMSELGETGGSNAIIMNTAGFALLGILMIAFAFGLHRGISEGKGSKIGPALIAISGVAVVGAGIFPCDPGCVNESFTGMMHSVSATIPGVGMALAPFFIAERFKNDRRWESYRLYTMATGVVTAFLGLGLLFVTIEGWMGALQRISMGVPLLWIEIMAIRLLRLS